MQTLLFDLALAFILTHEIDAVRCREWRILPGLNRLSDAAGQWWFIALHVPLFALLFGALTDPAGLAPAVRTGVDIFLMVHLGLHVLYLRNTENRFVDALSWSLIVGAGVCGGLDLAFGG